MEFQPVGCANADFRIWHLFTTFNLHYIRIKGDRLKKYYDSRMLFQTRFVITILAVLDAGGLFLTMVPMT